ncbi:DNA polymerase (family 10) [Lewinella marina]|uniref:DNA polymerase/3'-5' exonuclease PolX n=1 Tax=Neolewinella marina TaxID=438751 RepID=A0A2G0CJ18_9BACT|nr:DNA polymerase/3'-5' exonuclease PolX [Neolewinella marina]NJB84872.1 DNA polymerase (family 10) [Neolewinella marina]PHK99974.1 DNA polymerase/3'-5' exonuclease PolX [Neolewinella marina]
MTNPEIARHFRELGKLMELHGDNPFKIRSYTNAYNKLRKEDRDLAAMTLEELQKLEGVGKAIAEKIHELATTGRMETLEKWRAQTPEGVREMLNISGFGPKKVKAVWDGLGVTTVGQLLYAINENRLVELKGFGLKTQETLKHKLEFLQKSRGRFLYPTAALAGAALLEQLRDLHPGERFETTGALRRGCPTLSHLELLTTLAPALVAKIPGLNVKETDNEMTRAEVDEMPVTLYHCIPDNFGSKQFRYTGSPDFLRAFVAQFPEIDFSGLPAEEDVFARAQVQWIAPELREGDWILPAASATTPLPEFITAKDIRGVVHTHTTYSDGIYSLREMAVAARDKGYEYIVISDHSQAAFYANGLKPERVREQWAEIDALNAELAPFRIIKGTECDILSDGSLDYDADLLAGFEIVIASIHSNLNMDEERATQRLLAAIANPHTTILGHPTGRLLLSREGYPIDHKRVIDACAEHGVAIELNANPYRLDLDWSWIPYATERGVAISINPDAHSTGGIDDIHWGTVAARKGGLTSANCLNADTAENLLRFAGRKTTKS